MKRPRRHPVTAQHGFFYAEVLLGMVLLATLLVPALQALNSGILGNAVASSLGVRQLSLRSKMEEVLSQPFGPLYAETYLVGGNTSTSVSANFSDASGANERRLVVLYRFDQASNALTASNSGLLYVSVYFEAEGSAGALNTLAGRWW
jgi:hypothetical protein